MKYQIILLIVFANTLSLTFNKADAQFPVTKQWDYRYGGINNEKINAFIKTTDGGFLLGGHTESDSSGDITEFTKGSFDFWIVKLNSTGNKQWDKRYGGVDADVLTAALQTNDGGYLLGGISLSGIGGDKTEPCWGSSDYWIIKIDSAGTKQWDKRYGSFYDDNLTSLCQVNDGGYLLSGTSDSPVGGDKTDSLTSPFVNDYWIIKIDANGNKLWDKDFGGINDEALTDVEQTPDNGFLLAGFSNSDSSGDKTQHTRGGYDYWVVKTDSLGNYSWDKRYGGNQDDELFSFTQATGGGYVLAGFSFSGVVGDKTQINKGVSDYWIIKTDANGNIVWDKDFGGSNTDDDITDIVKTADGGYLIPTTSYSPVSGDKTEANLGVEQSWIIKTDQNGNKQWDKTIFTTGHDEGCFIIEDGNGCYVIASRCNADTGGYKSQPNWDLAAQPNTTYDYWIVKLCDTTETSGLTNLPGANDITVSPNPFTSSVSVNIKPETIFQNGNGHLTINIKNVFGIIILSHEKNTPVNSFNYTFDLSSFPEGMYLVEIITGHVHLTKKMVKY